MTTARRRLWNAKLKRCFMTHLDNAKQYLDNAKEGVL